MSGPSLLFSIILEVLASTIGMEEGWEGGGRRDGGGRREGWRRVGEERLQVLHSPADGTHEAVGVVGLAQRRHHLALDELVTAEAAGPVQSLVVLGADVLALPHEEAALGQVTAAFWGHTGGAEVAGDHLLPGPDGPQAYPSPHTGLGANSGWLTEPSGGQAPSTDSSSGPSAWR